MATNKNQEFAKKALSYVGQGASKFREWFYGYDAKAVPWCAVFVSYVSNAVNILDKIVCKCDGAGDFPRLGVSKNFGKWYEGNTKPKVGDIILFTWNGKGRYESQDKYFSDHVGVVYKVDSKYVYTVEGNTNGTNDTSVVSKRKYALYSGVINGYYRPDWSVVDVSDTKTKLQKGDKGADVLCLKYLIQIADDMGVIDYNMTLGNNKFSAGTESAIKALQKIMGHKQTGVADEKFINTLYLLIKKSYPLMGDINGDGRVDVKDVTAIQKKTAGID